MSSPARLLQAVAPPPWRIVDREHERVGLWIEKQGGGHWHVSTTSVGLEHHGRLVAGVMYESFNGASLHASVAITGRLNREYLWFICHYPFVQLHAKVVIATVASDNFRSRRFVEHFGFERHTSIPDAHPSGALIVYTLPKNKCRWLGLKGNANVEG